MARSEEDQARLAEYEATINAYAEETLRPFLGRIDAGHYSSTKELNDPIWGTIVLRPPEVLVVDSPVLQRLRRIKQLGVVHLVYPAAVHTRFEHSIGALRQLSELVAAINQSALDVAKRLAITPEQEQLLRLTALFHDVGHGLMSHVSENALASSPEVNAIERSFNQTYDVEKVRLSELAAFYIVQSPAARELLTRAWQLSHLPMPAEDLAEFIGSAIIGRTVSDETPLLHEVITGPYDADKLDYMARDSYMAGVPQIVDVERLTRKIRVASLNVQTLPEEIAEKVPGGVNRSYFVTAVAASGARTLDELALARALLHDKVYRHQKVRSAEAMVGSVLRLLGGAGTSTPVLPLRLTDEAFLDLDCEQASAMAGDEDAGRTAADIVGRLRDRRLFVRGFAWSATPDPIGYTTAEEQTEAFHELGLATRNSQKRERLTAEIAEVVVDIAGRTDRTSDLDEVGLESLARYICIDPPMPPKGRSLLRRAYLLQSDGTIRRFREEYPDTEGWADQYLVNREIGYVFCPREIADLVHLATEAVFRQEYGARQPATFGVEAKVDTEPLRKRLADSGFYAGRPHDLRPLPKCLTVASAEARIESVVKNAREYTPPTSIESDSEVIQSTGITAESVKDFLRQFATDDEAELGLRMLEATRFFTRADFNSSVDEFLRGLDSLDGVVLVPIGTAKDSGSVVGYYATDAAQQHGVPIRTIHELTDEDTHIVFVDDFIGSGRQAVDILETWLGETRSADLGEDRSSTVLPARLQDHMREATISFVYCAGWDEGLERLRNRLTELGLQIASTVTQFGIDDIPSAFSDDLLAVIDDDGMRQRCEEIGTELLASAGDYGGETAKSRSLGYGGKSLLAIFPYNTPAQSLTLLWQRGEVDGVEWRPLFPRRRKE